MVSVGYLHEDQQVDEYSRLKLEAGVGGVGGFRLRKVFSKVDET